MKKPLALMNAAALSYDGRYRYWLSRKSDGSEYLMQPSSYVLWVMLNPSTADGTTDDATIRRCRGFTKSWELGGFVVVNLYDFRSTDWRVLRDPAEKVSDECDSVISMWARYASKIICAWGGHIHSIPYGRNRALSVEKLLRRQNKSLFCLGRTKLGFPNHPLMLPSAQPLESYNSEVPRALRA